jgi:hypothetical protein
VVRKRILRKWRTAADLRILLNMKPGAGPEARVWMLPSITSLAAPAEGNSRLIISHQTFLCAQQNSIQKED